jgi:hypothetical protein
VTIEDIVGAGREGLATAAKRAALAGTDHKVPDLVLIDRAGVAAKSRKSLRWSFHLAPLGPTGAHWPDDPPDVTCKDSTGQHSTDGCPLSVTSRLAVRVPRQLLKPQVTGLQQPDIDRRAPGGLMHGSWRDPGGCWRQGLSPG